MYIYRSIYLSIYLSIYTYIDKLLRARVKRLPAVPANRLQGLQAAFAHQQMRNSKTPATLHASKRAAAA